MQAEENIEKCYTILYEKKKQKSEATCLMMVTKCSTVQLPKSCIPMRLAKSV